MELKRIFLCVFFVMCMLVAMVPGVAWAAVAEPQSMTTVDLATLTAPHTIEQNGNYLLKGTGTQPVVVKENVTATLVLENAVISAANAAPIELQGNANVTLVPKDGTTNTFTATGSHAGILVPVGATLMVDTLQGSKGDGVINANGGAGSAGIGTSQATGTSGQALSGERGGNVMSSSGTVHLAGGEGGTGGNHGQAAKEAGAITINGGVVYAKGGAGGAGIGGGKGADGTDGTKGEDGKGEQKDVTWQIIYAASGGGGGGAGGNGGRGGNGGVVTITGGKVVATGNEAPGIGGGAGGAAGKGGEGGSGSSSGSARGGAGGHGQDGYVAGGNAGTLVVTGGNVWATGTVGAGNTGAVTGGQGWTQNGQGSGGNGSTILGVSGGGGGRIFPTPGNPHNGTIKIGNGANVVLNNTEGKTATSSRPIDNSTGAKLYHLKFQVTGSDGNAVAGATVKLNRYIYKTRTAEEALDGEHAAGMADIWAPVGNYTLTGSDIRQVNAGQIAIGKSYMVNITEQDDQSETAAIAPEAKVNDIWYATMLDAFASQESGATKAGDTIENIVDTITAVQNGNLHAGVTLKLKDGNHTYRAADTMAVVNVDGVARGVTLTQGQLEVSDHAPITVIDMNNIAYMVDIVGKDSRNGKVVVPADGSTPYVELPGGGTVVVDGVTYTGGAGAKVYLPDGFQDELVHQAEVSAGKRVTHRGTPVVAGVSNTANITIDRSNGQAQVTVLQGDEISAFGFQLQSKAGSIVVEEPGKQRTVNNRPSVKVLGANGAFMATDTADGTSHDYFATAAGQVFYLGTFTVTVDAGQNATATGLNQDRQGYYGEELVEIFTPASGYVLNEGNVSVQANGVLVTAEITIDAQTGAVMVKTVIAGDMALTAQASRKAPEEPVQPEEPMQPIQSETPVQTEIAEVLADNVMETRSAIAGNPATGERGDAVWVVVLFGAAVLSGMTVVCVNRRKNH